MGFLSGILRFLIWVLLLSWGVALLRRVFAGILGGGALSGAPQRPRAASDPESGISARRLVRDPVCGVHVAEELSIPFREGGELLHFCSIACRDKYTDSTKKFAANA